MIVIKKFLQKNISETISFAFSIKKKEVLSAPKQKPIDTEALKYLQEKLKKKSKHVLDKEDYKIDCGMIIDRAPIFLYANEKELSWIKFRLKFYRKYNLFSALPKDLMEFTTIDPNEEFNATTKDNIETHEKKIGPDTYERYHSHSKHFSKSDPNITDKRSIQYAGANRVYLLLKDKQSGKWTFPTTFVEDSITFTETKMKLVKDLSNTFTVFHHTKLPVLCLKRELNEQEKNDVSLRKCVGVKTFYFAASHFDGQVQIIDERFSDYAWVPRLELNQLMDRKDYQNFVHSLSLY